MSLSIFTYAIFTGLCGFATEAWHIAVLRFVALSGDTSIDLGAATESIDGAPIASPAGAVGIAAVR